MGNWTFRPFVSSHPRCLNRFPAYSVKTTWSFARVYSSSKLAAPYVSAVRAVRCFVTPSVTGLSEEISFQFRSELSATVVWWEEFECKCVPDNWNVESIEVSRVSDRTTLVQGTKSRYEKSKNHTMRGYLIPFQPFRNFLRNFWVYDNRWHIRNLALSLKQHNTLFYFLFIYFVITGSCIENEKLINGIKIE